jgi:dTDP-glucose pyrophosphorylase
MIVFPMLGRSSRFYEAGYSRPKYELLVGGETLFSKAVKTFESHFDLVPFLFLVRKDCNALEFVTGEISKLGIKDFRIMSFDYETRGQADSVMVGLRHYDENLSLMIFNIDTIRENFNWPSSFDDGFVEVFESEGDHWSFIEPLDQRYVARTTEKVRISNLCSNGMYGFSSISLFKAAFENSAKDDLGELYIAPLYNHLIKSGYKINYRIVSNQDIFHCGLPIDYELTNKIFLSRLKGSDK